MGQIWYLQYFTYWIASFKRFNQLQVITWVSGLPFINRGFSPSTSKNNSTWQPLVDNEKSHNIYYKFIIIKKSCYSVGVAIICVLFVFSLFLYFFLLWESSVWKYWCPRLTSGSIRVALWLTAYWNKKNNWTEINDTLQRKLKSVRDILLKLKEKC